MLLRRNAVLKYFLAVALGAAIYCEWFIYLLQPVFWNQLECNVDDSSCVKILFVADPQIQGDDAVPPPLSYLFNWDSDRYLKSTFTVVMRHFKPDVIVYMGDLMDEGSICTMQQFHGYVKRLANIFDVDYPITQIWIPGDNDIGGENEPIKKDKVEEFRKVFDQPDIVDYRNISFYKVNGITQEYLKEVNNDNFKIVVSHYPITVRPSLGQLVNNAISPHIYFCAHDHGSKYVMQNKHLTFRQSFRYEYGESVLKISFNNSDDKKYEIYVPTCSYRMGTSKIGYGAAILENHNQNMRYTVFWSSQRFPYLIVYLIILLNKIIYCCVFYTAKCCYRTFKVFNTLNSREKRNKLRREDEKPFLERI